MAEHLDRDMVAELRQVEFRELDVPGEVGDDEDRFVLEAADEGQHLAVLRMEELDAASPEGAVLFAQRDEPLHPPQQRVLVVLLRRDVDRLVVVLGVGDDGEIQPLAVGRREPGVAVAAPLHGRPDAVAIADVDVVAHADLVAVVEHGRARQGEEEPVHELDAPPVVAHQRREAAPDAQVDAHLWVLRIDPVHVVALLVGHHLERQLIVVAQEERPLRGVGDGRRLVEDVDDREPILHPQRHVHPWHEREVERHVALVAGAEVGHGVLGPLVGLGEQHPVAMVLVDVRAKLAQEPVRLGQVLAVGALTLVEVGDRVEAQPVDAHLEPEVHGPLDRLPDPPAVEVEVGLVGIEAVPVVGSRDGVPRPVRRLEVLEDDPSVPVAVGGIAPHVVAAGGTAGRCPPRTLEPRMLIGRVVADQLGDDAQAAPVRLADEGADIAHRPVVGMDARVVGDVVPVVLQR